MQELLDFWRRRLALHGAFVFLIGLLVGFLFMFAQDMAPPNPPPDVEKDIHRWKVAHMQGLTHGFLLWGMAAAFPYFRLNPRLLQFSGWALIVGSWSAVAASLLSAHFGVDGRDLNSVGWDRVCFVLFGAGVAGVLLGLLVIVTRGAWEAAREGLAPNTWKNWAKLVFARPRFLREPKDQKELEEAVQEAIDVRMPVRAYGAGASWNACATTHGMMIDTRRLSGVLEFKEAQGGNPALVKVKAGTKIGDLSSYLASQQHTLETATVIPWVRVGGVVANGCHGTGTNHPQFTDLVFQLQIIQDVNGVATLRTYDRPPATPQDEWDALLVSLGTLGILYSVTFECVPMFNVRTVDSHEEMRKTIENQLQPILSKDYPEIFWFPYAKKCWIKTWHPAGPNDPVQGMPAGHWFWQWLSNRFLGPPIFYVLALIPWLTPPAMKLLDLMVPRLNRVVPLPDAMHYQRHFAKGVSMGCAIPYDPDPNAADGYETIKKAWFAVVDRLEALRHQGIYPQNLVLHARFVREGRALIAPTVGYGHACYIEILTYRGTPRSEEFFAVVERDWLLMGGRPHWGKLTYHPDKIRDAYPKPKMETFLTIREQMDPKCVFLNDYLREILRVEV